MYEAMQISASALTTSRLQMDLAANNLANINTTRGADGQPYRRRYAVLAERQESFQAVFGRQGRQEPGGGVQVTAIQTDQSLFKLKYDPTHPDADANGMVRLPNVDMLQEITDMMMATRVYEANVTALNAGKAMETKALEIGRP